MEASTPFGMVGIVIALGLILIIILVATVVLSRSRVRLRDYNPRSHKMVDDAHVKIGERKSSLVSEQLEEMVRFKLAAHPDLARVKLDFGAMPDGTIDIWVNETQYDNPEDIPDERIRQAIKEAVQEFNG